MSGSIGSCGGWRALIAEAQPGTMLYPAHLRVLRGGCRPTERDRRHAHDRGRRLAPAPDASGAAVAVRRPAPDASCGIASCGEEVFGPSTVVVRCGSRDEMEAVARQSRRPVDRDDSWHARGPGRVRVAGVDSRGQGRPPDRQRLPDRRRGVRRRCSTAARTRQPPTRERRRSAPRRSHRFARPVAYQNFPQSSLPVELQDANPRGSGAWSTASMTREAL